MGLTPEEEQAHNEKMIQAHDEAHPQDAPQDGQEDKTPELPEGVTMEMLLESYNKSQEPKEEDKTHEGDSDTDPEEEPQDKPEEEDTDEELSPLEERIKQLEDEIIQNKIYAEAGGEEGYNALRAQAEENLSEHQLELMNAALTQGTAEQAAAAVQLMKTMFSQELNAQPTEKSPQELEGKEVRTSMSFTSEADFHAAISNPLYKSMTSAGDKYRNEVNRKLINSKF